MSADREAVNRGRPDLMDISDLQATLTVGTCSSRMTFSIPDARSMGTELGFGNVRLDFREDTLEAAVFINNGWDTRVFLAVDQQRDTLARVRYLMNL